jgi:hypothetical protein
MSDLEYYNKFLNKTEFILSDSDNTTVFLMDSVFYRNDNWFVNITWLEDDNKLHNIDYNLDSVMRHITNKHWLTKSYLRKLKIKQIRNDQY